MKRHILTILSLLFIALAFSAKADVSSFVKDYEMEEACIFDSQQSDIELIFDAASDKTIVPELQNSLPLPSFRLISSQKKTQQNLINNILLKRFSSEVQPTKNYNIKYSFPLSSKDDLIVIVRHLII
ncbi:MAG: hypothetical protein IIV21_00085 [Bacteroidales bacterium]|nr:hypothetical protein [Bacteroidales bacterium]